MGRTVFSINSTKYLYTPVKLDGTGHFFMTDLIYLSVRKLHSRLFNFRYPGHNTCVLL